MDVGGCPLSQSIRSPKMAEKLPFMETTPPADAYSALAVAGSAETSTDVHLPVVGTLQDSRRKYQKVMLEDQAAGMAWFWQSGRTATMQDQMASLVMLEKAMSVIPTGSGKFGFLYTHDLEANNSCFENSDNFILRRQLGSGVSGVVTAYSDKSKNHKFVRKRMKAASLRMEEVQSLLKLRHPGVCKLYALLCHNSCVDLLLQDAGFPLRECLQKFCNEKISAEQYWQVVKDLGRQGFEALSFIHHEGICHLDIKPENILLHQNLQKDLVLVMADFGSSVSMKDMMTLKLQMTPEYWAPEIWQHVEQYLVSLQSAQGGKPEAEQFPPSAALDTFAMALVLYFMATLQHFVLAQLAKKDSSPVVSSSEVEELCRQFGGRLEAKFAFNFLLIAKNGHRLVDLATQGPWLFDGMPSAILEVMRATLNPDPASRWTDEQAAFYLSGNAGEGLNLHDQLKIPTPVDDPTDHSVDNGEIIPELPLPKQEMYTTAAADDSARPQLLGGAARFQQQMAPLLKAWDNVVPEAPSRQPNGKPVANIPSQPATQVVMPDDINLPRPQQSIGSLADVGSTKQTHRPHLGGLKAGSWQGPDMEEETPCEDIDVDMQRNVRMEQMVPDPSAPGQAAFILEKEKGSEDHAMVDGAGDWEEDGSWAAQGWNGEYADVQVSSPQSGVANQMGALSIQPVAGVPRPMKPLDPATSLGKGGGGRLFKPRGKVGKESGGSHRAVSQSAPMKVASPGKKGGFPHKQKRLPPEFLTADQPVTKIPFVVASSGRKNPSPRTLHGMSVGKANPNMSSMAMLGKAASGTVQIQALASHGDSSTVAFTHQGFQKSEPQPSVSNKRAQTQSQKQVGGEHGPITEQTWMSDDSRPVVMDPVAVDTVSQLDVLSPSTVEPEQLDQEEAVVSISMDELLQLLLQNELPVTGPVGQQNMAEGREECCGAAEISVLGEPPPMQAYLQGMTSQGQGMVEVREPSQNNSFSLEQLGQQMQGQRSGTRGAECGEGDQVSYPAQDQGVLNERGRSEMSDVDMVPAVQQIPLQVEFWPGCDEIGGAGHQMSGGPGCVGQQIPGPMMSGQGGVWSGLGAVGGGGPWALGDQGSVGQMVPGQALTEASQVVEGNMPNFEMIFE